MDRREFLRALAGTGAAAAAFLFKPAILAALEPAARFPHLVAVKGGSPGRMFAEGIAALGGMGRFVPKGGTVVVKPNIGWDVPPERAATTNPALVKAIVEACLAAGAKRVYVLDNPCDGWQACYRNSGIEAAAKAAGATVAPASSPSYYHQVQVKGARVLAGTEVHELILGADALINVPVLKSHGGAGMTCALKNLMGAVWNREAFHANGLDQAIAEAALVIKPALNVVDASRVMLSGGPRGNSGSRYAELGMQILSPDIVAADAAAAKAFGNGTGSYGYLDIAASLGIGTARLESLDIRRISL
jgi:uncharacterized protein (DUF362 family)